MKKNIEDIEAAICAAENEGEWQEAKLLRADLADALEWEEEEASKRPPEMDDPCREAMYDEDVTEIIDTMCKKAEASLDPDIPFGTVDDPFDPEEFAVSAGGHGYKTLFFENEGMGIIGGSGGYKSKPDIVQVNHATKTISLTWL